MRKLVDIASLHAKHKENPPNAGLANHTQKGVTVWRPWCPSWNGDNIHATQGRYIPV